MLNVTKILTLFAFIKFLSHSSADVTIYQSLHITILNIKSNYTYPESTEEKETSKCKETIQQGLEAKARKGEGLYKRE